MNHGDRCDHGCDTAAVTATNYVVSRALEAREGEPSDSEVT